MHMCFVVAVIKLPMSHCLALDLGSRNQLFHLGLLPAARLLGLDNLSRLSRYWPLASGTAPSWLVLETPVCCSLEPCCVPL